MQKIRLKCMGKKGQPSYRLVIMPSTSKREGKTLCELGFINPITKEMKLDLESIIKNLDNGIQATKRVISLLKLKGIIQNKV